MSTPTGGLGRGLGALIPRSRAEPDESPPAAGEGGAVDAPRLEQVRVDAIRPNPRQPRLNLDADALEELVASIREVGVLQPVVVRPGEDGGYELVMGERRWRAVQELGLEHVPAVVRTTDDDAMLRDALLENLHREQLNPLEEAAAYEQLVEELGATHEEVARRVGKSRSHVTNTLRLVRLGAAVQRRVAAGVLSAGHARALLGCADVAAQEALAARVVAEGWSVRATEEAVALQDPREGLDGRAPRREGPPREADPRLQAVADRLADRLDTRVTVSAGRRKGRLVVEFAGADDLDRIAAVLQHERPSAA